jgi:subtilase family serine protease
MAGPESIGSHLRTASFSINIQDILGRGHPRAQAFEREKGDMKRTLRSTRAARLKVTVVAFLALVGAVLAALAATAGHATAARGGVMTPAVGPDPRAQLIGSLTRAANQPGPLLNCQKAGTCYGPDQMRNAYGFQSLLDNGHDGTGSTIVIIDAFGSDTIQSDLADFDAYFGLAAANLNIIEPDGTPSSTDPANLFGWKAETTLDVETAHAIAPGATLDLVVAKSNSDADILSATEAVAKGNFGDVVSQSFGEAEQCEASKLLQKQHATFAQLAGNGTTLFASAGDDGAGLPTCDGATLMKAASTPATDPKVTAVGGTDLVATPPTVVNGVETAPGGQYESETVWNDAAGAATGGGISTLYAKPGFQNKVVSGHMREIPDIAYSASAHHDVLAVLTLDPGAQGAMFGVPGGGTFFFGFSGTSCGSPQWAALVAIADQVAGHRIGDINPTLYALGQGSSASSVFNDVTVGNNNVGAPFNITGFSATPGWDAVTGWGSPQANNLVPALAAASG